MNLKEALKTLNIYDYKDKIINSNSRGEIVHLLDYIHIAQQIEHPEKFRPWFEKIVEFAKHEWQRPESVYQHIYKILVESWEQDTEANHD